MSLRECVKLSLAALSSAAMGALNRPAVWALSRSVRIRVTSDGPSAGRGDHGRVSGHAALCYSTSQTLRPKWNKNHTGSSTFIPVHRRAQIAALNSGQVGRQLPAGDALPPGALLREQPVDADCGIPSAAVYRLGVDLEPIPLQ